MTVLSNEVIVRSVSDLSLLYTSLFKINLHLRSDMKPIEVNGKTLMLFD